MTSEFDKNNLVIDEEPRKDHLMHSNADDPVVNEEMVIDEEEDEDEGVEDSYSDEIDAPTMANYTPSRSNEFDDDQASGNLSDVKRFCGVCEMSFYSMRQLSDHLRDLHGIDKPFQCDICKARFPYSSSLYNHTRIHSEKKPFRCDECDAAFRWKNSLKHHKRFIHKVVDPAELEKLNETTFTGALKSMGIPNKRSMKRSSRNKKPYGKVVVGVSIPQVSQMTPSLKLLVTSAGSTAKGSKLRSLFPQIYPKVENMAGKTLNEFPKQPKTNGERAETITIEEENILQPKHTCGHCGQKFNVWQTLAKHLVDCEKILASGHVSDALAGRKMAGSSPRGGHKESFFDSFTKNSASLPKISVEKSTSAITKTEEIVEITSVNGVVDDQESSAATCSHCNCETSKEFMKKFEQLEKKFVDLERNSNERIAKLEATVADLYEVAAEMDEDC